MRNLDEGLLLHERSCVLCNVQQYSLRFANMWPVELLIVDVVEEVHTFLGGLFMAGL